MKYLYILITNKEEIAEDTEYAKEAPKRKKNIYRIAFFYRMLEIKPSMRGLD